MKIAVQQKKLGCIRQWTSSAGISNGVAPNKISWKRTTEQNSEMENWYDFPLRKYGSYEMT